MNQHLTKGVWTAGNASISKALSDKWECHIWSELNGNRVMVATVYGESKDQAEANAKVISASLDLLDALQAMDVLDSKKHLSEAWWKQAQKADELRNSAIKKSTT